MHRPIIYGLCLLFFAQTGYASDAIRFFPDALEQDDKITLSPAFSPDGKTIYFAQSECSPIWKCPQRLKVSTKTQKGWTKPKFVDLPTNDRVDWPSVSPDGKTLLFSWAAEREDLSTLDTAENFDIYTLDLEDRNATPRPILGADINRPRAGSIKTLRYVHNESYATLTNRGDLYFMTERLDGTGERDIYVARHDKNGGFKTAIPLPAPINSENRDDGVWINPEGTTMLISYPNRGGEGGGDIFISRQENGVWSQPKNLGPSINTRYDEFAARLTPDGSQIIFTSNRPFGDTKAGLLQVWVADLPR